MRDSTRSPGAGPPWLRSEVTRARYDGQWLFVVAMMLLAAATFFGWRALAQVVVATGAAGLVWLLVGALLRRLGWSRRGVTLAHVVVLGALVGLSLPLMMDPVVPLVMGLVVGLLGHFIGRGSGARVNLPALMLVLLCFLPATVFHTDLLTMRSQFGQPSQAVLRPSRVLLGDVANASPPPPAVSVRPWTDRIASTDATRRRDMALLLSREQRRMLTDRVYLVNLLRSHELARMGELFLGAVPGPIGATSPVLLIAMGMYLFYRRLASWRTALAAFVAALVTYGLMPIDVPSPVGVPTEGRLAVVFEPLTALGPAAAMTFLGYLLLATPWCLIVFILAPLSDPMSRAGRWVYGVLLGIGLALCQWWLPVPEGAFVALLAVSLLSRPLDAMHRSPFVR